jgi:hypothetical protein
MFVLDIKYHQIAVLDFNSIFNKHIETDLLNDLEKFGLIDDGRFNIKNKQTKKLFYHHIINGLANFFLNTKIKHKSIIFYTKTIPTGKQVMHMSDIEELQSFLNKTILKIYKLLPLKWYFSDHTFRELVDTVKKNTGDSYDLVNRIRFTLDGYDTSKFTYAKARIFADRHGLQFLTNNFFKKIYSKQLILS